jgi:hypothetical protein
MTAVMAWLAELPADLKREAAAQPSGA